MSGNIWTDTDPAEDLRDEDEVSESASDDLLAGFEEWLCSVCFQKPTPEAYDLARDAWLEAAKRNNLEESEKQFYEASEKLGW